LQKINIKPASEKIKLYPNPAKDYITIQGDLPAEADITFLSSEGKIIFTKHILTNRYSFQLNLPGLANGIYFLKINNQVKKIIIQ